MDAVGHAYVADRLNGGVRRINPAGVVSTFAGYGSGPSSGDGGAADEARFLWVTEVELDAASNLFVRTWDGLRVIGGAGHQIRVPVGSGGDTLSLPLSPSGAVTKAGRPVLKET